MVGKIKFFDTVKGYGFITCAEYEEDIFVHHTEVLQEGPKSFEPGDKVDFDLGEGRNGRVQALRVSKVE